MPHLTAISDFSFKKQKIKLFIKREDLVHPSISGNKWHKLKYNLQAAKEGNYDTLLTFGGAFSNHIHATSIAGKQFGFKTIGIIRGEIIQPLNPSLSFAKKNGMHLEAISRTDYRKKDTPDFIQNLRDKFGNFYLLPEGGTNDLAIKACAEIVHDIDIPFDYLCASCGTGGTFTGIVNGLNGNANAIGFSALKGGDFLVDIVQKHLTEAEKDYSNWTIQTEYHFGGFAKVKAPLIDFMRQFYKQHKIKLDPIYTGKMLYGIYDLIDKGYFPKGSTIIAVHTGGLQGITGMEKRLGIKFY